MNKALALLLANIEDAAVIEKALQVITDDQTAFFEDILGQLEMSHAAAAQLSEERNFFKSQFEQATGLVDAPRPH